MTFRIDPTFFSPTAPNHFEELTMKQSILHSVAVLLAFCVMTASTSAAESNPEQSGQGKLRHVVLFKFKDGTTPDQIKTVEDAFRALPTKIPQIVSFEWGTNNSPENLGQGFTHCFFLTFNTEADRAVYLPHKAHKAFGKLLHPYLEKVLVIDYVAKP
jgi:hypothetical protein